MQISIQLGHQPKAASLRFQQLHKGFILFDPDRANGIFGDPAGFADLGQQPARFGAAGMADRQAEPDRRSELSAFAGGDSDGRRQGVRQNLGGRAALAPQPHKGGGNLFGAVAAQQGPGHFGLFTRLVGKERMFQHAQILAGLNLVRAGGLAPVRRNLGPGQQTLRLLGLGRGHDQG